MEMMGDSSAFRNARSMFIDFHPDIHTSATFRENWDLTDLRNMTIEQAGAYLDGLKISFIDGRLPDGTYLSRTKWNDLISRLVAYGFKPEDAMKMMVTPVQNTINIRNIYSVRDVENLPEADITRNTRGEKNLLDPLFIRIEGASGIKYDMSDNRNNYEEGFLSGIYSNLGLHETTYDGFGVVSLRYYPNPLLDIIYLTERSKITN
ncbi:hypothetical protein [Selenomonas ruminantium]|uniref:hypothetical protein n=1 Tax=Selenomonas ruminantium TaxID=971 RepID=UPI0026ECD305|nr:hypothetical protein [Selenomonas ruminantium]